MTDDDWDEEWEAHVREELIPKITGSTATLSLVPKGETDVKFAVELGFTLMLDKPLILIVPPGTKVPKRLRRAADAVIEGEIQHPKTAQRIREVLDRVLGEGDQP